MHPGHGSSAYPGPVWAAAGHSGPVPHPAFPGPPALSGRHRTTLVGAACLLAGVFLGALLVVAVQAAPGIGTREVTGTLLLGEGATANCTGFGGYSDIRQGAGVTVRDSADTVIATSQLDAGKPTGIGTCVFPFTVQDVPRSDFYSFEVSHRGQVMFERKDVESGPVRLTLGT